MEKPPQNTRSFVSMLSAIRPWLDTVAAISMIVASVVLIRAATRGHAKANPGGSAIPPLPSHPLPLVGRVKGDMTATVGMIEFADFQCPFCAKFARDIFPGLSKKYIETGKLLFAFRHFPLSIHQYAPGAAAAAECAGQQGAFWSMHDKLFTDPTHLDPASLEGNAQTLKLNIDAYDKCVSAHQAVVDDDTALARSLQIKGTPVIIIGRVDGTQLRPTKLIVGAQTEQEFEVPIESVLAGKTLNQ
jgi:protein-disulfide isomerase